MNRAWIAWWIVLCLVPAAHGAVLKVACVGDSITEGTGLADPARESYPARLGRLLGADWQVRNFGVSGRTLLKKGDFPYWNEPAYTQSRNYAPDVVIIKLGTNDSKPLNWRHSTNFVSDFTELIASYAGLASHPRVLLATPCPVFANGAFLIRPGIVATNIAPAVRELAQGLGLEVVDFHTRLAGHSEWFPDTVHPNTRGMAVLAAIVWQTLTGVTNPPPVALEVARVPPNRVAIAWPADGAGQVLLAATALAPQPNWLVADGVPLTSGESVLVTNTATATARYYQLWQP